MAYDEELADRIRAIVSSESDIAERKMFGGLAFLKGGHMAVAASGQGGILVRVDPQEEDSFLAEPGTSPMEMRGRPMKGWLRVAGEPLESNEGLARWVHAGLSYAGELPPK